MKLSLLLLGPSYGIALFLLCLGPITVPAQTIAADASKVESSNKLIGSLPLVKADEASLMIDLLMIEVAKTNEAKGMTAFFCGVVCRYGEIEAHLRGIEMALRAKQISEADVAIVFGGFRERSTTEFWLVHQGRSFPITQLGSQKIKFIGKFGKRIVHYDCCY